MDTDQIGEGKSYVDGIALGAKFPPRIKPKIPLAK